MNIKTILIILLTIVVNYPVYLGIKDTKYSNQKHTYCGSVIDISTQLRAVKHGTRTDYHMLVAFDSIGTRLVDVSPETFYIYGKEGNRVCFDLSNKFVERISPTAFTDLAFSVGLAYDTVLFFYIILTIMLTEVKEEKPKNRSL